MGRFRHFLAIDWSGAAGLRHKGIALALCAAGHDAPRLLRPAGHRFWSRTDVFDLLVSGLPADTLVGMDLGMSLPFVDAGSFFPDLAGAPADARELWALVDETCADDADLGVAAFVDDPRYAPYFRRHGGREGPLFHLPGAAHRRGRFRVTEAAQAGMGCKPYSNFNLVGAAQVGKSSLSGMRLLNRLAGRVPVWPVDPLPASGSVVTEIYTSLAAIAAGRTAARAKMTDAAALDAALAALGSIPSGLAGPVDDHSSDAIVTSAWLRRVADRLGLWSPAGLSSALARTEGWTFGAV